MKATNGTGNTSVIDYIRFALTNESRRDYIIHRGESEGEIIVKNDIATRTTDSSKMEVTYL